MSNIGRWTVLAVMAAFASTAAAEDSLWMARFELGMTFGGTADVDYVASFGTAYAVEGFDDSAQRVSFMPVTGIRYAADIGARPLVLGMTPGYDRTGAREGDGISWGWWAAGAGVLAAAVLAGGSDTKTTTDDDDNNDTRCGVGGNRGLIPIINLECLP